MAPIAHPERLFCPEMTRFGPIWFPPIPGQLASWPRSRIRPILRFGCIATLPLELSRADGMLPWTNVHEPMMTDENDKTAKRAVESRQDRLKSALRENLKRRKVQARERTAMADPSHDDEASLDEGSAGKADG
jgi:hypothetical protein